MRRALLAVIVAAGIIGGGVATAAPGPNLIVGTNADDSLIGTQHPDIIAGRGGRDFLAGRRGDDFLGGGAGNDRLSDWGAHSGSDVFRGGAGSRDRCIGDASDTFGASCEIVRIR